MKSTDIAATYYDAFRNHTDFSEVPLADSVVFQGPSGAIEGAAAFRQAVAGIAAGMKQLRLRHQLEGEDTVVSVYDFDLGLPDGPIPMAEVLRIEGGEIAGIELVFDSSRLAGGQA